LFGCYLTLSFFLNNLNESEPLRVNTVRAHSFVKNKFCQQYGDYDISDLSVDNILDFMNQLTEGRNP
jgi:hypothetical protein